MANISDGILGAHHDLFLADWGRSVTYTRVTSSVNISTGAVTESTTDSIVTASVGPKVARTVGSSGSRYLIYERSFEIKTSDLPEDPPRTTSRITHDMVYDIVSHVKSSDGLETIITARANKS